MSNPLEGPLYNAGIRLYRLGVRLAGLRNTKARRLSAGQRGVWERLAAGIRPGDKVIWVHAASLGEFEQGRPLMEKMRRTHPDHKILLTFFSPSGYGVRKDWPGADCVTYLPFDTPANARRFVETVRPEAAIFVKYEIWRNYLRELRKHGVPTYLISAVFRADQHFFRRPGGWGAGWLRDYTRIFVQDEVSRKLLAGIGMTDTEVCGDTRFDRVSAIRAGGKRIPEIEAFTGKGNPTGKEDPQSAAGPDTPLVFMAGSTWAADVERFVYWFEEHPEVKLVLAPHEFDAETLWILKKRFDHGAVLYSEIKSGAAKPDADGRYSEQVLIMDCFGLLSSAYAYCDIAYVGGGFGAGLHNINEAAVYGVPVIYGPNNRKFIEAREMAEAGGGFPVASIDEIEAVATRLATDTAARLEAGQKAAAYIRSKLGATDRIHTAIFG